MVARLFFVLAAIILVSMLCSHREHFPQELNTDLSNGLGDRLLDMSGLFALNAITDTKFAVEWVHDPPDRAYDPTLLNFSKLQMFSFDKKLNMSLLTKTSGFGTSPYFLMKFLRAHDMNPVPKALVDQYIKWAQLIDFHPDIKASAPPGIEKCIAIHLRRTDKLNNSGDMVHETNMREYEMIMSRMKAYIDQLVTTEPTAWFYVISDDAKYKETFVSEMIAKYPSIVVTTTMETDLPDYVRRMDGAYSILEFYCLTRCRMILQGIKMSTFSTCAALISQAPLVSFMDYTKGWSLLAWKPCIKLILRDIVYDHVYDEEEGAYLLQNYGNIAIR